MDFDGGTHPRHQTITSNASEDLDADPSGHMLLESSSTAKMQNIKSEVITLEVTAFTQYNIRGTSLNSVFGFLLFQISKNRVFFTTNSNEIGGESIFYSCSNQIAYNFSLYIVHYSFYMAHDSYFTSHC
jgi:hypothetical protein